jgi:hypothetical protein
MSLKKYISDSENDLPLNHSNLVSKGIMLLHTLNYADFKYLLLNKENNLKLQLVAAE